MALRITLLAFALLTSVGHTKDYIAYPLPVGQTTMESPATGIVFPSFHSAATVNAGALAMAGKGPSVQAAVSPAMVLDHPTKGVVSYASSNENLGLGLGFHSLQGGSTSPKYGFYAGVGMDMDNLGFGTTIREPDFTNDFEPEVDMGFAYRAKNGISLAAVLAHLELATQLALGAGFRQKNLFHIEYTVVFPPFSRSSEPSASHLMVLAGGVVWDKFDFKVTVQRHTKSGRTNGTLGVHYWMLERVAILGQFTNPSEVYFGLSFFI